MYAFYVPRGLLIQLNKKIKKKSKKYGKMGKPTFCLPITDLTVTYQ